jgi:hypothetical protein
MAAGLITSYHGQQKLNLLEGSWSKENLLGQDGHPLAPGFCGRSRQEERNSDTNQ